MKLKPIDDCPNLTACLFRWPNGDYRSGEKHWEWFFILGATWDGDPPTHYCELPEPPEDEL